MTPFTISKTNFLNKDIQGFYHTDYVCYKRRDEVKNYPMYILTLKNEHRWPKYKLDEAQKQLLQVLMNDLLNILKQVNTKSLTVCVVPRAKADDTYRSDQLLFKATIRNAVKDLGNDFIDGTSYIKRHTNTMTTHLRKPIKGYVNDGKLPYPGISRDTCTFSNKINGSNILLIDDIYTRNVNVDEDMLQALLNCYANSVVFYAIGKTVHSQPSFIL